MYGWSKIGDFKVHVAGWLLEVVIWVWPNIEEQELLPIDGQRNFTFPAQQPLKRSRIDVRTTGRLKSASNYQYLIVICRIKLLNVR